MFHVNIHHILVTNKVNANLQTKLCLCFHKVSKLAKDISNNNILLIQVYSLYNNNINRSLKRRFKVIYVMLKLYPFPGLVHLGTSIFLLFFGGSVSYPRVPLTTWLDRPITGRHLVNKRRHSLFTCWSSHISCNQFMFLHPPSIPFLSPPVPKNVHYYKMFITIYVRGFFIPPTFDIYIIYCQD